MQQRKTLVEIPLHFGVPNSNSLVRGLYNMQNVRGNQNVDLSIVKWMLKFCVFPEVIATQHNHQLPPDTNKRQD